MEYRASNSDLFLQGKSKELVERAGAQLGKAGCKVQTVVEEEGDPTSKIIDRAEHWNADLIVLGSHGRKGLDRFMMGNVAEKVASSGNRRIILTERGASFGYNNLVVDMRTFPVLRKLGYPVVYDVTHSVQLPGGQGQASGGQPEFIEPLARAGVAAGVDGIFLETHDNPAAALSDGANALPLEQLPQLLGRLKELSALVRPWSPA